MLPLGPTPAKTPRKLKSGLKIRENETPPRPISGRRFDLAPAVTFVGSKQPVKAAVNGESRGK
jgi:hypothetical protein